MQASAVRLPWTLAIARIPGVTWHAMKPTNSSMEVTTAAPPRRFNRKQVLEALLEHPPEWVSSIKDQYDGSWSLLLDNIIAKLPRKLKRSLTDMLLGRSLPADEEAILPEHIHFGAALIEHDHRWCWHFILN